MFVCMHACVCMHVCVCVCVCVCLCLCMCTYMYVYMCLLACTSLLVFIHRCIDVGINMYVLYSIVHTLCIKYLNFSDQPLDLLIDYFKKFGHKPCCFDHTHGFVTKLLNTADADKVRMASVVVCVMIQWGLS